jgi:heterodisulfide reductase subunit D
VGALGGSTKETAVDDTGRDEDGQGTTGAAARGEATNGNALRQEEFVERWRTNAYGCFSSGHKFCREVCPVMQVTRNENHTPTAFHASIVAMEKGLVDVADVADDFVHCTQCGACELRCPNTLFTGDFYRHRTRTVDVVKAMRALMVETGNERAGWKLWNERLAERHNEPVLGDVPVSQEHVADWAEGLDIPVGGETILFVDCEAAFYRTSYTRAFAQLLQRAGVDFGLMREQWCCGGPAAEMGYADLARKHADHNVADWQAVGARRIIAPDPHDFIAFTEDYPRYYGDDYEFEIVLGVELINDLVKEGRLELTTPVERTVTYHDPCRLNKRKGVHEAPRELLRAVPGLTFKDVDHVTQWSYCSGGGGGLPVEKPEITEEISRRRVARAAALEVDTLISACPWSERPLSNAASDSDPAIGVMDLFELVAEAAGIAAGGHTHGDGRAPEARA